MASCSAKSGRFHYYTCQNYVKRGSAFCDQKLLNASKIEPFIIKLLRERVLTRENIRNLFLMINEEVATFEQDYDGRVVQLDRSLEETLARRKKLYNGIETGKLDLGDVAPRLRELNAEIECLNQEKLELERQKETRQPITMTESELKPFVDDLLELLVKGSISERKGFIRSFVKRIYLDYPNIEIEYTVPLPDTSAKLVSREVLCIGQNGDPNGIRTRVITVKG
jgi:site-specific DNA recombinase